MYRKYDNEFKQKVIANAMSVRNAGGTWAEALAAAKEQGYGSSIIALQKLMKTGVRRKVGRPKGSRNRSVNPISAISEIEALVESLATKRAEEKFDEILRNAGLRRGG